jgi:hypothetical protein
MMQHPPRHKSEKTVLCSGFGSFAAKTRAKNASSTLPQAK